MPTIDLGEQRIVVSGVLVQNIVFDDICCPGTDILDAGCSHGGDPMI
mgnify:CR=1 FL=1